MTVQGRQDRDMYWMTYAKEHKLGMAVDWMWETMYEMEGNWEWPLGGFISAEWVHRRPSSRHRWNAEGVNEIVGWCQENCKDRWRLDSTYTWRPDVTYHPDTTVISWHYTWLLHTTKGKFPIFGLGYTYQKFTKLMHGLWYWLLILFSSFSRISPFRLIHALLV